MADRRGIVVPLIILAFIFLTPEPPRSSVAAIDYRAAFQDAIAEEERSLAELRNSSYIADRFSKDTLGLNLTGLETERGYTWSALPHVQDRARQQLQYALRDRADDALDLKQDAGDGLSVYSNVTGFVHGKWVRSKLEANITAPALNLTEYAPESPFGRLLPRPFERNVSGDGGDVRIRFHERESRRLILGDSSTPNVTHVEVEMSISDDSFAEEHDLRLLGVYFPTVGQAILTTTSDKFAGIFALPHMALSEPTFETAASLLNQSITTTIQRQLDGEISSFNPWSTRLDGTGATPYTTPQCEMIVYIQQLPLAGLPHAVPSSAFLRFLEMELRFPTGAFISDVPEMRFSMVAFSPDCGFVIESQGPPDFSAQQDGNHLSGSKVEMIVKHGRHHLIFFAGVLALQLALLIRQMREANTPSTRSKLSFYTLAMLALGDGFATMSLLLTGVFISGLWVNLIGTAFLSFVSVSFFGMKLLMDVWAVQAPERLRRAREEAEHDRDRYVRAQQALRRLREIRAQLEARDRGDRVAAEPTETTDNAPPDAAPGTTHDPSGYEQGQPAVEGSTMDPTEPAQAEQPTTETTPTAATAQQPNDTGASPVFMPSDQDGLQPADVDAALNMQANANVPSFGSLYTRFYLLLLGTLFLSLNAASWPSSARRVYFTTVALLYLSFWLPQIHRNVQRNCRHALNWEYVAGQSILRLTPFAYFYGFADNVLFAERDFTSLTLMALWLWVQVVMLLSQEIIGPRWFIRKDWAPPAYDYHPVLREDEEGANMPIGFSQATSASAPGTPLLERRPSFSAAKESKERRGKRVFDCAICMQDLEVPVVETGGTADSGLGANLLARRTYMVTPCRHIFHSACLEGWMKYRLQCPICRETLPPL